VLASLKGYLQRRLRSCALRGGLRRNLDRLSFSDPTFDLVQAAFPTHLVEGPDILRGLGEKMMPAVILVFGHGD
jgi:hypothetical protein